MDSKENALGSVCIATYRRPQLLKKCLKSIQRQILPANLALEIIVVDNDHHSSAKTIVDLFKKNGKCLPIHYYVQPQKNIALTRNMAVSNAKGDYIFFIDDDEMASAKWAYHLIKTLKDFDADGVFGPIYPDFNGRTPEWMKGVELFYRPVFATGTSAMAMRTGNCVVKASHLKQLKTPFDIRYGITGGADSHLFERLVQSGCRFVNCRDAWVCEYVPASKTNVQYLFRRGLQGGNIHTRRALELSPGPKLVHRLSMVAKATRYGYFSLLLVGIHFYNPLQRTRWLIKLGSNIGRFLASFSWHYQGYR